MHYRASRSLRSTCKQVYVTANLMIKTPELGGTLFASALCLILQCEATNPIAGQPLSVKAIYSCFFCGSVGLLFKKKRQTPGSGQTVFRSSQGRGEFMASPFLHFCLVFSKAKINNNCCRSRMKHTPVIPCSL